MNEARKLDSSSLPEIPVKGAKHPNDGHLPPLPHEVALGEATLATSEPPMRQARSQSKPAKKGGGWGRALLVLFLVGMMSFAATAGLTASIVLGNFDMRSGRIKETMQSVKGFVQQLRN